MQDSTCLGFVSGIKRFKGARKVKSALAKALKNLQFKYIKLEHNSYGHAVGYGWILFLDPEKLVRYSLMMN